MYHFWSSVVGLVFTPDVFTHAPNSMSTFFNICGDQISHMLFDIHAALSLVALFVIFNECPIDTDESVAHVNVAPVGTLPWFQNDGSGCSKPPIPAIAGTSNFVTVRSSK